MTGFYDVMDFFAYTLRFFGALAFGVGAAWMAMHLLKGQHANWQLSAATFLGLLAAFVLVGHWVPERRPWGDSALAPVVGCWRGAWGQRPRRPAGAADPPSAEPLHASRVGHWQAQPPVGARLRGPPPRSRRRADRCLPTAPRRPPRAG